MTVWPVTRSRRIGFAPAVAAPNAVQRTLTALPVASKQRLKAILNEVQPTVVPVPPVTMPARRKPVQPPAAVPATPLPATSPKSVQPPPPPRPAPTAIRDAAETRIKQLRGQIRQDCAALANSVMAVGRRIEAGETPRQEGEFGVLARRLDQDCASLYECLRLTKCY